MAFPSSSQLAIFGNVSEHLFWDGGVGSIFVILSVGLSAYVGWLMNHNRDASSSTTNTSITLNRTEILVHDQSQNVQVTNVYNLNSESKDENTRLVVLLVISAVLALLWVYDRFPWWFLGVAYVLVVVSSFLAGVLLSRNKLYDTKANWIKSVAILALLFVVINVVALAGTIALRFNSTTGELLANFEGEFLDKFFNSGHGAFLAIQLVSIVFTILALAILTLALIGLSVMPHFSQIAETNWKFRMASKVFGGIWDLSNHVYFLVGFLSLISIGVVCFGVLQSS